MRAWKTARDPLARALERELKELDPRIEVDFIDPEAAKVPPAERAPGLCPGRWHIIIKTDPHLDDAYFPILGENKGYREPELSIVEEMKERDMWRRGFFDEMMKNEEKAAAARVRQELVESEARVEQVAAAYRAAKRVAGDGGVNRRHDRKGRPSRPAGGDNIATKTTRSGVILPAGA
jgi:hypothetical protein